MLLHVPCHQWRKSHLIDTNQLVDEIETMVRQRVQELEEAKSKEIIRSSS